VQLALFASAASVLRSFRRKAGGSGKDGDDAEAAGRFTERGWLVSGLAIAATLLADVVALIRWPSRWVGTPGSTGAVLVMAALAAAAVALVAWSTYRAREESRGQPWARSFGAGVVILACCAALAFSTDAIRGSLSGAVASAATGLLVLFLATGSVTWALSPQGTEPGQDLLDVAASFFTRTRGQTPPPRFHSSSLLRRLDPRRHPRAPVIAAGAVAGAALLVAELLGEGLPPSASRSALVGAVLVGLEGTGVVLGYAIFREPLGILRKKKT